MTTLENAFRANEQAQIFGLVGESGCGKSTSARVILRLNDITGGKVIFNG